MKNIHARKAIAGGAAAGSAVGAAVAAAIRGAFAAAASIGLGPYRSRPWCRVAPAAERRLQRRGAAGRRRLLLHRRLAQRYELCIALV